jgi:hypothetical protein
LDYNSGVPQERHASSSVAIMLNNKLRNRIYRNNLVTNKIIVGIKIATGYLTVAGLYSPGQKNARNSTKQRSLVTK